jgi:uncharacterized protein
VTALVLTPGASATREHPSLIAIEEAVSPLGVEVVRLDLPKRADKAAEFVAEEAAPLRERHRSVILGGRSFGGRVCSMAVADGFDAAALVLVSYPLHPPGKPDQLRTAHLPRIEVPCLFVSGTRDAFATPAELEEHTAVIGGPVTHVWIDGGDHGLRRKDQEVAGAVARWVESLRLPDALS